MPNWVSNGLTIEGKPDAVNKLVEQMNTPFVDYVEPLGDLSYGLKQIKYVNPIFSFRNIIAPTDLEAYKKQPVSSDKEGPEWWSDIVEKSKTDNSWYNWNIRNWGVKWDVAVSEDNKYPQTYMEGPVSNGDNLVVYYNFDTPWGIADKAIETLSSQYPSLLFTLSYEEETGWGGEAEFLRGVMISHSEYDNMCKDCDATNQMEWCEECENEICGNCNWLGEADLESVKECQTHSVYLATNVPEYRKLEG
jgi:hypothetical protein